MAQAQARIESIEQERAMQADRGKEKKTEEEARKEAEAEAAKKAEDEKVIKATNERLGQELAHFNKKLQCLSSPASGAQAEALLMKKQRGQPRSPKTSWHPGSFRKPQTRVRQARYQG